MGFDTTPNSDDREPEGRDEAPPWFLLVVVVLAALGGLWFIWTFFNMSGY